MTHFLTALVQATLCGAFVYALMKVLEAGLEDIGNRLVNLCKRKRPTLQHALLQSGAIRKP